MKIPVEGAVEIRRDPESGAVYVECVACSDELVENAERSLFECASCGHTATMAEMKELAAKYVEALSSEFGVCIEEKKRRGLRWLFTTLFGNRKERRALTS